MRQYLCTDKVIFSPCNKDFFRNNFSQCDRFVCNAAGHIHKCDTSLPRLLMSSCATMFDYLFMSQFWIIYSFRCSLFQHTVSDFALSFRTQFQYNEQTCWKINNAWWIESRRVPPHAFASPTLIDIRASKISVIDDPDIRSTRLRNASEACAYYEVPKIYARHIVLFWGSFHHDRHKSFSRSWRSTWFSRGSFVHLKSFANLTKYQRTQRFIRVRHQMTP